MKLLITICARGGSKGIPGKNIKLLNGVPLIHYTYKVAMAFAQLHNADIQVSTDSDEILDCLKELDYETSYVRPSELATDTAGKISVIRSAVYFAEEQNHIKYDIVLDLDVTSPLRTLEDLNGALDKLNSISDAVNIFSVNLASRNPYFNMVEESSDGFVKVVKDNKGYKTRQETPAVYDMNASFYFFRRSFFEEGYEISTTSKSLAYVMNHICFDLDHAHDFLIMETLLKNNILKIG
jgi:CMP-N,N'-diacetyllegionaminic acid synthase